MGWFEFLKLLLSLSASLTKYIANKQLMDAGEAKASLESIEEILARVKVAQNNRNRVDDVSDDILHKKNRNK